MRLPADARLRILALGLTAALATSLAGCGLIGGSSRPGGLAAAPGASQALVAYGPAADYPIVLGEPFTVDGELYSPSDTMNYDAVGYAALDRQGGAGVTLAHRTLPLPSYVEITALDTGRTTLARVERRGPMTGTRLVALSPGAQAQLQIAEGAPVRVRRVNPPEADRAELRAGNAAPERMETPKSLVEVLRRKLPANGAAILRSAAAASSPSTPPAPLPVRVAQQTSVAPSSIRQLSPVAPRVAARPAPVTPAAATAAPFEQAFSSERRATTAYPLPPLTGTPRAAAPVAVQSASGAAQRAARLVTSADNFVIQAAAFSSKSNAEAAAGKLGGFITPAGKFYRVRTGPYASRGQAEAALAKVRAAGYSDARVSTAG